MNLLEQLKIVVDRLRNDRIQFALAGGLASSIYRAEKRTTDDLDFLILVDESKSPHDSTEAVARKILSDLNLETREARQANLQGGPRFAIKRGSSPLMILVGRKEGEVGIDFMLPTIPWAASALQRAQDHQIEFSIGKVPCITVEDVVIAKFYSLANDATRFKDADDIKSIFEVKHNFDFAYLVGQMKTLGLTVPTSVEQLVPLVLRQVSKKIRRDNSKTAKNHPFRE